MEDAGPSDLNVGEGGISAVSVKLRGLPFKALEQDISVFFEGYNVQRALLKRYPDGRPNGEVSRTPYRLASETRAAVAAASPVRHSCCKHSIALVCRQLQASISSRSLHRWLCDQSQVQLKLRPFSMRMCCRHL